MSPRTTLAYGVLALLIGVLWASVSVEATLAGYVLVVALVFFGGVFLIYAKLSENQFSFAPQLWQKLAPVATTASHFGHLLTGTLLGWVWPPPMFCPQFGQNFEVEGICA